MGDRHIFWEPWSDVGLEHLRLTQHEGGAIADGLILRHRPGAEPLRLWYRLKCERDWTVREAEFRVWCGGERRLGLLADGAGRWHDGEGRALEALEGCVDVDLTATAFTNTLPVRRLGLKEGESAEIRVAYVAAPDLRLTAVRQRYTCLSVTKERSRYLYEGLDTGFVAELPLDADGVVLDYPGLARRRFSAEGRA
jgi:uncharacterized protein